LCGNCSCSLVIDAVTIPDPSGPAAATAGPELAVLAVRVLSCTDTSQLETWTDRAATALSLVEVFGT